MKKMQILLTILAFLAFAASSTAQSGRKKAKWDEAILSMQKSEFAIKFQTQKDSIEARIAWFQRNKEGLTAEEIADIKKGYELSVEQYENVLQFVKESFTITSKRKFMSEYPDSYSKLLERDLNEAQQYYKNSCEYLIDVYTNNQNGALGLIEVAMLVTLGKELWSIWQEEKKRTEEMSAEYFEENFISHYRFKKWEQY
jgi:hypothetical protein